MFVIIPHLDTWSLCSEDLPWGVQEDGRRINKQDAGRCKFEMLLEHEDLHLGDIIKRRIETSGH